MALVARSPVAGRGAVASQPPASASEILLQDDTVVSYGRRDHDLTVAS